MNKEIAKLWKAEDYWAVWIAAILLGGAILGILHGVPSLKSWTSAPLDAFRAASPRALLLLGLGLGALFQIGVFLMGREAKPFAAGFVVVFLLALVSFAVAAQSSVKAVGLEYVLWALLLGMLVANTVGTPAWLKAAAKPELYVKTGLVLLGAEILFSEITRLGPPGLLVAWVVTPTVIVFMWLFGTRWLKMPSKALTIVVAVSTSVCGVSAAIATAAACRAKKEELTLAIGMTMVFTTVMMVAMPVVAKAIGLDAAVAGAWLGGTIDSTGAVVAAGAILGEEAERVAAVIKMVQNILIGVVAFFVALFWVARIEHDPSGPRPGLMEVWYRFPKFILGFVLASLVFSFFVHPVLGEARTGEILDVSKALRAWLFCLAFVAIGLESNFREMAHQLVGGKPVVLYLVGQTFNILLTLLVAWLAFGGILFPRP